MTAPSKTVSVLSLSIGVWHAYIVSINFVQIPLILFVIPPDMFDRIAEHLRSNPETPEILVYLYSHHLGSLLAMMVLSMLTAISCFAAWRRKRLGWSALMLFLPAHIVIYLASPVVAVLWVLTLFPADGPIFFKIFTLGVIAAISIQPLAFGLGHAWLLYTLTRPHIRAEFS